MTTTLQPPPLPESGMINIQPIVRAGLSRIIAKEIYPDGYTNEQLLGVAGELIFSLYLSGLNIPHQLNKKWLANEPVPSFDLLVYNWRMDVKTFPRENTDAMIKKRELENEKKVIEKYILLQILDEVTARFWIKDKKEISTWPQVQGKFGMNYKKPIKDL